MPSPKNAMSDLTLYRLQPHPGGGFHFGQDRPAESGVVFASDSLYSALLATVAGQEGAAAAEALAEPFLAEEPPFRLTSLFPHAGKLPLLPLPMVRIRLEEVELPAKFGKDVQFVSPGILERLCRGDVMDEYLSEAGGRFLQEGAVWLTAAEQAHLPPSWVGRGPAVLNRQQVWRRESVPRVALDRITSSSAVFQAGRVTFNDGCGLWLGVRYEDEEWRQRLEGLLSHLGDRGIGGERSAGYGAFTLQRDAPLTAIPAADGDAVRRDLLLSRYLPREDELAAVQDEEAAYRLVSVGGWLASPQSQSLRRRRVRFLAEGSVVGRRNGAPVRGRMADVAPDAASLPPDVRPVPHPVYRCGLALTVPVVAGEAE